MVPTVQAECARIPQVEPKQTLIAFKHLPYRFNSTYSFAKCHPTCIFIQRQQQKMSVKPWYYCFKKKKKVYVNATMWDWLPLSSNANYQLLWLLAKALARCCVGVLGGTVASPLHLGEKAHFVTGVCVRVARSGPGAAGPVPGELASSVTN